MKTVAINLIGFVIGFLGIYTLFFEVTLNGLRARVIVSLIILIIALILFLLGEKKVQNEK